MRIILTKNVSIDPTVWLDVLIVLLVRALLVFYNSLSKTRGFYRFSFFSDINSSSSLAHDGIDQFANVIIHCIIRGVPRIWEGGAKKFFFRFGNLHVAKRHAAHGEAMRIARGFGGVLPRENCLKRCNLVRFRVYFDQILSLFFSKKCHFYIKNKYFRYTFVMGYFS